MNNRQKHATLSEVAKRAGVGMTTVSRVVNGGQSVDPKTMARVQRAVESLGYMPNQAARTLKGDRTHVIGFVVPSIADPFFASCTEAAQAIARRHDSLLIVLTTQNDTQKELGAIRMLTQQRVDGMILTPADSGSLELRDLITKLRVPVIALDRPIADAVAPSVLSDNFRGAQHATEHLIAHGFRRILCLTGESGLFTIQERIRGYRAAMQAAGLEAMVDATIHDHHSSEQVLDRIFRDGVLPEAIFTLKNSTTIDTFAMLQKHRVAIPDTIGLLGYDDFPLAGMVRPSISVVQQPIDELGHVAAELLFQRLLTPEEAGVSGSTSQQLPTRLIRRASCGCETTSQDR